jgi:hypothetical protein
MVSPATIFTGVIAATYRWCSLRSVANPRPVEPRRPARTGYYHGQGLRPRRDGQGDEGSLHRMYQLDKDPHQAWATLS